MSHYPPYQNSQTPYSQNGYYQNQQPPLQQTMNSQQSFPQQLGPQDGLNGVQSQMAGMSMGTGPRRKKDRHAHHDISQATPQLTTPQQPQYLQQSGQSQQTGFQPQAQLQVNAVDRLHMGEESVPASGRVDPDQIPSVTKARDAATQFYQANIYPTMEKHLPPVAAVSFVAVDQGNASPKIARLTANNIPSTSEAMQSTGIPLGLILQPLAAQQEGEEPVPVLDFGEVGPPRCRRCRTYVNPFMTFKSGGNKLVCNMCSFANDVAPEYFAPTDPSGVRVDRMQRPELMLGTVEFTVPKEYWSKPPTELRYLFCIDTSQPAIDRGVLYSMCTGIQRALYEADDLQQTDESTPIARIPPGAKVGIITYDKQIVFYNLSPSLAQAQMLVMPDLEDPFVALADGLFVDPAESKDNIEALLTALPNMFTDIKSPEPCLLPALNAALAALTATGGKVICSLSALPIFGPGKLMLRDDGKGRDTDAERRLFTTEHPGFKKTANAMVSAGIGVDFFLAVPGGGYIDIATIGHLARLTGGEVFYYPAFVAPRDTLKMAMEITHAVRRTIGFQALMKVRCSNGLQVSAYHGAFLQHTFGADLEFGTIDADKAMGVSFSYDGKLDPKLDAHFQAALLYTTASGQRRVRCINVVAGVCDGATDTMRTVDQDAVVAMIAKEAASQVSEKSLKDIRSKLTEKTVDILAGYRKNFSGSHPPGQLVLPEHLKQFPMYTLSLIKSRAFKGGIEPTDRRVYSARFLRTAGVTETALYLYPRIFAIHNFSPEDCFANPETYQLNLPPTVRASFSKIEEGGAYIIDDGQQILLWLHAHVSPNLVADLFGPEYTSLQSLDFQLNTLPVLETLLNTQVRNLLAYLATVRGSKAATIQLARQGLDGSEYEFARLLLEDRNNEAQAYVDWLVQLHRSIQMELSGQRKKDESAAQGEGVVQQLTGLKAPYWN